MGTLNNICVVIITGLLLAGCDGSGIEWLSDAEISINENQNSDFYFASAIDSNKPDLAFSYNIDGPDAKVFTINTQTGAIQFITPPDFERPKSANDTNQYHLQLKASDRTSGQTLVSMELKVTVNDIAASSAYRYFPMDSSYVVTAENASTPIIAKFNEDERFTLWPDEPILFSPENEAKFYKMYAIEDPILLPQPVTNQAKGSFDRYLDPRQYPNGSTPDLIEHFNSLLGFIGYEKSGLSHVGHYTPALNSFSLSFLPFSHSKNSYNEAQRELSWNLLERINDTNSLKEEYNIEFSSTHFYLWNGKHIWSINRDNFSTKALLAFDKKNTIEKVVYKNGLLLILTVSVPTYQRQLQSIDMSGNIELLTQIDYAIYRGFIDEENIFIGYSSGEFKGGQKINNGYSFNYLALDACKDHNKRVSPVEFFHIDTSGNVTPAIDEEFLTCGLGEYNLKILNLYSSVKNLKASDNTDYSGAFNGLRGSMFSLWGNPSGTEGSIYGLKLERDLISLTFQISSTIYPNATTQYYYYAGENLNFDKKKHFYTEAGNLYITDGNSAAIKLSADEHHVLNFIVDPLASLIYTFGTWGENKTPVIGAHHIHNGAASYRPTLLKR